jgi:predicted  nucleic acid-binding Zn-ribbon protein
MNYCPQCGKPLPSQNVKFCPECGCNLSAQPEEKNDVVCPDCGMVFDEAIPSECPNCGCPSELFKPYVEDEVLNNTEENEKPEKKSSIKPFLIALLCIIGIGCFLYVEKDHREKAEEQREQREKEEAQEKENKRIQHANEVLFAKMTGTYYSDFFYYKGTYVKYRIALYSSGNYEIEIINDYRQVVLRKTGRWEAYSNLNSIVLDRESQEWGAIEIVGNHLKFGDVECY